MAWDQHLIAEPEGPSFISRTVAHRRLDRRSRDTRPKAVFVPQIGLARFSVRKQNVSIPNQRAVFPHGTLDLDIPNSGVRGTFGVNAIQSDVPLHMVQRWLGHASKRSAVMYPERDRTGGTSVCHAYAAKIVIGFLFVLNSWPKPYQQSLQAFKSAFAI